MVQFHSLNYVKMDDKVGWKTYEEFYQFFNEYHAEKAFQSFLIKILVMLKIFMKQLSIISR